MEGFGFELGLTVNLFIRTGTCVYLFEIVNKCLLSCFTDLKDLMLAVATRGEINSAFIFLGHMAETSGGRRTPLKPEFALLKQVILSGQVGTKSLFL